MQMPHVLPAAQTARVGQAMIDALTCLLIFYLGRMLFGARAGLLAALAFSVDLRFITQTGAINTETLVIFLLVSGAWAFVAAHSTKRWRIVGYGVAITFFLFAAFTRAVALPLIALFALLPLLPRPTRPQLIGAGLIVGVGLLIVGAWVVRTYRDTGQVVIISDGLGSNFWMGSRLDGQWHGLVEFNKERADLQSRYGGRDAYVEDALRTIAADPAAYVRLLFVKVTSAYMQPYGTVVFGGESLKNLAAGMLRGERSLAELVNGEAFWPKLIVYIFHYTSLLGGLLGLWLARRDRLKVLPLVLPIVYFTAAYTFLTIIPRYIFPTMPFYMILAAFAGVVMFDRVAGRMKRQTANVE
jgi:4-amino-4-deoxy-L-arabinose transferase-like glycosyltransferase